MQEHNAPLCEVLSQMKKNAGLTNREIAEISGIPEATVTKVMNGDTSSPNLITVGGIVKALGGSMDEIMGLSTGSEEEKESETIRAYQLLLESKQQEINRLEEHYNKEYLRMKKDRNIFLVLFICILAVFILILFYDLLNGNVGYIRYQMSRGTSMLIEGIKTLMHKMPFFSA